MKKLFLCFLVLPILFVAAPSFAIPYEYQAVFPNASTFSGGVDAWWNDAAGETFSGGFDLDIDAPYFSFSSSLVSYNSESDLASFFDTRPYNLNFYQISFNSSNLPGYSSAVFQFEDQNDDGVFEMLTAYHYIDGTAYGFSRGSNAVPASANPVPEPATMLLLGTGLVGLAGFRRKFKR